MPWGNYPLVNEFPKSGGSWLAQMLAEALEIQFPRNRLPHLNSCLLHGHYLPKGIKTDVVIVYRDGRDVLVSLYYHRIIENDFTTRHMRDKLHKKLGIKDPQDISQYLPRFIEASAKGEVHPYYSWSDFMVAWGKSTHVKTMISYESLHQDAALQLVNAASCLGKTLDIATASEICKNFTFKRLSDRPSGTEDVSNYLRKGIIGDWQEKFTEESRQIFAHYHGSTLMELGYESNDDWI